MLISFLKNKFIFSSKEKKFFPVEHFFFLHQDVKRRKMLPLNSVPFVQNKVLKENSNWKFWRKRYQRQFLLVEPIGWTVSFGAKLVLFGWNSFFFGKIFFFIFTGFWFDLDFFKAFLFCFVFFLYLWKMLAITCHFGCHYSLFQSISSVQLEKFNF